jgi:hypothetical protein
VPRLDELRLHQGTVWRWNRAIYDSGFGGHLRIEMRPLPAGPTVTDMLANAAFLLGLTLALAPDAATWTRQLLFARAHANFYEAARLGLEAELEWPGTDGSSERVGAVELVRRLLPTARQGLVGAGVDADEADRLLGCLASGPRPGRPGPSGSAGPWPRWRSRPTGTMPPWTCWSAIWNCRRPATRSTAGRWRAEPG